MTDQPTCYRHPDRETGLSCSVCGRPVCVDCATFAPVGIRCPEHSGKPQGVQRVTRSVNRRSARQVGFRLQGSDALVTKTLVGVNVLVYLIGVAQGGGINAPGGSLYDRSFLYGPYVAQGDWWRLITTAFLHANLLHIAFNMLALWWFGAPVENYLGRLRYTLLYFASALAGSAGALLVDPTTPVLGASGAIFGVLGAMLIIEWQATGQLGGNAFMLIVINLALSFVIPNISWGGHVGGLVGGIVGTLALARFGRGHAAYGRPGLVGVGALVLVGVLSVVIAYYKVRGYA